VPLATTLAIPDSTIFTPTEWERIALALGLSPRETQIVRAIFDDLSEPAIAGRLGISAHTVHTYTERLYQKLRVNGRIPLVLRILAEHLGGPATSARPS
jgi:DNA-binding NarL/FixJ family response regulator